MTVPALTIRIPLRLRRHGGRKLVIVPEGSAAPPAPRRPDDTMVKALARAWRWKRMIESGKVRSLNDIAEAEKLNSSYVSRIFRLTLLAPDIVEAILAGRQPRTLQLEMLREEVPAEWHRQREMFGFASATGAVSATAGRPMGG